MRRAACGFLAVLIAWPAYAETYGTLVHRYESEIRRQERQLHSLQRNLQEKQEKAAEYRTLAEKAKAQWQRLSDSVKTAEGKVKLVRTELEKTSRQVQAAGWQVALENRLSGAIDAELSQLTAELLREKLAGEDATALSTRYPTQIVEKLTDYAPVVRQDAQAAMRQHQTLTDLAQHWQDEEVRRRRDADTLKATQEDQWKRWQQAQRREQLLREEVAQAEQSAQALQIMLSQLKESRDQARAKRAAPAGADDPRLAQLRGRLPWPAHGDVVQSFGRQYSSDLNQLLVSNGIRVQARAGQPVRAVQPGQVIFARPFHTYGQMVVVQHSNGLASVYASLATISVKEGAMIGALEPVGTADGTGRYYFELRQEERPLDPLVYLTPSRRMSS